MHDVCKRLRLRITWPTIVAMSSWSHCEGKELSQPKKTVTHLLLVFPEHLEEANMSWKENPFSGKTPILHVSTLDFERMDKHTQSSGLWRIEMWNQESGGQGTVELRVLWNPPATAQLPPRQTFVASRGAKPTFCVPKQPLTPPIRQVSLPWFKVGCHSERRRSLSNPPNCWRVCWPFPVPRQFYIPLCWGRNPWVLWVRWGHVGLKLSLCVPAKKKKVQVLYHSVLLLQTLTNTVWKKNQPL